MPDNISFRHPQAAKLLSEHLRSWRDAADTENRKLRDLVFFCIGTAHVAGDSLGPLVGEALSLRAGLLRAKSIYVTGTVREPIHALNLEERYASVRQQYPHALIVAVDAGLGLPEQIGTFTLWEGSLFPGIALEKELPPVGDFAIAGIVGEYGSEGFPALQNASRKMVKKMADRISHAICHM